MGMKTLIEINNDRLHMIESDPESFASHLKLGINDSEEALEVLRILFGTQIVFIYHNSETIKIEKED